MQIVDLLDSLPEKGPLSAFHQGCTGILLALLCFGTNAEAYNDVAVAAAVTVAQLCFSACLLRPQFQLYPSLRFITVRSALKPLCSTVL